MLVLTALALLVPVVFVLGRDPGPNGTDATVADSGDEVGTSNTADVETTQAPQDTTTPGCGTADAKILIEGDQVDQYKNLEIPPKTNVDASSATWTGVSDYPIRLSGGSGVCWHGGTVTGTYPDTDSWDRMHDTAAFTVTLPEFVGSGIRVHNYGDGVNIVDDAENFTFRAVHLSYIRDDCIENDRLQSGIVEDSLLDGCYTALSARPNPSDAESDGHDDVWTISDSLIRLQPMPTVYKGEAPGHGRFFKWDNDGRGPSIELHGNVFRADQAPNDGDLGVPESYLASCSDNVMVWLGDGEFPGVLPDCFTITTDKGVWDEAVANWAAAFEN